MNELKFGWNWNLKLDCMAFTTLRLSGKFKVGEVLRVTTKSHNFLVTVCEKRSFFLKEINNWVAYIDTGYDADECRNILRKMYKNKNVDWDKMRIYFYLLVKIKEPKK